MRGTVRLAFLETREEFVNGRRGNQNIKRHCVVPFSIHY